MCVDTAERIVAALKERPMSCAIVDGDKEYRDLLAKVLKDLGFLVYGFESSQQFTAKNRECKFEVVVLSWDVEPFSGTEVVESIRGLGEPYPALIVGCDGGESVSLQLALSPVGFLFKPFDAKHLIKVLEKAVEEKR